MNKTKAKKANSDRKTPLKGEDVGVPFDSLYNNKKADNFLKKVDQPLP
jgi:hypothetical protein